MSIEDSILYTSKLISAFVVLTKDGINTPSSDEYYKFFLEEQRRTAVLLDPIV